MNEDMKTKILFALFAAVICFSACEFDNYEAPNALYSGTLLYNGKAMPFDARTSRSPFLFYQSGYQITDTGYDMAMKFDGTFSQNLFAGENYKLTLKNRDYPFEIEEFPKLAGGGYDTLYVNDVKGNIQKDFHVTPYYDISNVSAKVTDGKIEATFTVSKVPGTKYPAPAIRRLWIYVHPTILCSSAAGANGSFTPEAGFQNGNVTVSVPVANYRKAYPTRTDTQAYYRVGIELDINYDTKLLSEPLIITGVPLT